MNAIAQAQLEQAIDWLTEEVNRLEHEIADTDNAEEIAELEAELAKQEEKIDIAEKILADFS